MEKSHLLERNGVNLRVQRFCLIVSKYPELLTRSQSLIDPHTLLLTPHSKRLEVTPQLKRQIIRYLTTSFGIVLDDARPHIPEYLDQWGRFRIANGGDEVHANGYYKLRSDGRDSSFVRVSYISNQSTSSNIQHRTC